MNIAEKLDKAPKGTKLYSPVLGDVTFKGINSLYIEVLDLSNIVREFYHDGRFYMNGECMLFPSKDNRDWNNFSGCPYKKGDFIVRNYPNGHKYIAIFSRLGGPYPDTVHYLCLLYPDGKFKTVSDFGIGDVKDVRLATDEEKKELLDAMARNGYYWDDCSMTLRELKFKVGYLIHREGGYPRHIIKSIAQDRYICEDGLFLRFTDQNNWNVVKFDIKSLKPFSRVLVRGNDSDMWRCDLFSNMGKDLKFRCIGISWNQCIPYNDETKHLIGTKEDCPEYYKTW